MFWEYPFSFAVHYYAPLRPSTRKHLHSIELPFLIFKHMLEISWMKFCIVHCAMKLPSHSTTLTVTKCFKLSVCSTRHCSCGTNFKLDFIDCFDTPSDNNLTSMNFCNFLANDFMSFETMQPLNANFDVQLLNGSMFVVFVRNC